jgi:hypothetical protein
MYPYLEGRIWPPRLVREKGAVLLYSRTYTFQVGACDSTETKQHEEVFHCLHFSPNIIRMITSRMRWEGHEAHIIQKIKHTQFSWENMNDIQLLWKPMRRRYNSFKMDLKETKLEGVDWIYVTRNRDQLWRLATTIINIQVPWKTRNFLTCWVTMRSCTPWSILHIPLYHSQR